MERHCALAIGVDVSDSVLVEYTSGDSERLPVLNNEDIMQWHATQNEAAPIFGMNESDSTVGDFDHQALPP